MEKKSKLTSNEYAKIVAGSLFGTGMYLNGIKLLVGRQAYGDITEHIGDFSPVTIPVLGAKLISNSVRELGEKSNSKLIEKVGKYLPQIAAGAYVAYCSLGETILPQILPGTADPKDIPAAIIAGLSSAILFRNK